MSAKSAMLQAASAPVYFVLAMQSAEAAPLRVAVLFALADGPSLLEPRPTSQPNV
jgi:hypothetical protein